MESAHEYQPVIVMGVSGSGKSTVGAALAQHLGYDFIDGDSLHSSKSIEKMSNGIALDDEDRWPWLRAVGERLQTEVSKERGVVVACSALKRAYRDLLRDYEPRLFFVFLDGPISVLQSRVDDRSEGFMAPSLLGSQVATLEALESDELGVRVSIEKSVDEIVDAVLAMVEPTTVP